MAAASKLPNANQAGIVGESDNEWTVDFAEGVVNVIGGNERSVSAPLVAASISDRRCACGALLSRRQTVACSQSCRAKRMHLLHPQQGSGNHNFKGWRSKHPVLYTREFKRLNPEKVHAHSVVAYATRKGSLVRPSECASCLKPCRPDAHHEDYAKPLSVEWLCRKCHSAADRRLAQRHALDAYIASLAAAALRRRRASTSSTRQG